MREKGDFYNWILIGDAVGPLQAQVPGDILMDLYRGGKIEDPYYGANFKKSNFVFESEWTYTAQLSVTGAQKGRRCVLSFEGIDTCSQIRLNGVPIGTTDNMFLRYDFDVTDIIRKGENSLEVKILPFDRDVSVYEKYFALFNKKRLAYRKAQCHFGWDWAPDLPGMGIYLPVYVTFFDKAAFSDIQTEAKADGNVLFSYSVEGDKENAVAELEVFFGDERIAQRCVAVTDTANCIAVHIKDPNVWWPNGYGEQNLYRYKLTLKCGETAADAKEGIFGFKTVETEEYPTQDGRIGFALKVNGKRIFIKGSNWVPVKNQTGAIEDGAYTYLLEAAKNAGYNMLRVWGGGIYEKDIFYRKCDEYGILVWQDFMFSCSEIPEFENGFFEQMQKEAEYQLGRLKKYVCIALLCAGNELQKHGEQSEFAAEIVLRGYSKKYFPDLPYLANTPFTHFDNKWETKSGDAHISCFETALIRKEMHRFRDFIDENRAQFYTENISLGSCRMKSLRKFLPEDCLHWENNVLREHFSKNPHAACGSCDFATKQYVAAKSIYGVITAIEDFAKYANVLQGELMQAEAEYARANPDCNGFMNWMYNDNWGNGTFAVIDCYGDKKSAYYAQKRAYENVLAAYVRSNGEDRIVLVNDGNAVVSGELTAQIKTVRGKTQKAMRYNVSVNAGSIWSKRIDIGKEGYIALSFGGKEKLYFPHLYKGFVFTTDLQHALTYCGERDGYYVYGLTIAAHALAKTVFIDCLCEDAAFEPEDNYFDIDGGQQRTLTVKTEKKITEKDIAIKTICDTWLQ